MKSIDMTGQRFGNLVCESPSNRKTSSRSWYCRCDCGGLIETTRSNLRYGNPTHCGCMKFEKYSEANKKKNIIHGVASKQNRTGAYNSWLAMRQRCNNQNSNWYHRYGGRGILCCERWNSFQNFLIDMGERPNGMTLDRYPDINGNYEPGNCRWATPKQQADNK